MLQKIKNGILFVDEALPKNGIYEHANRLRFVRNLGQALCMRTVLAGTAASAANMLAATPSSSVAEVSRSGDAEQFHRHMLQKMKNGILFVDEALPKNGIYEHANRLRFVRNIGQALCMRTVLAGTAASAANMLAATPSSSVAEASRSGDAEQGWVQCVFVWQPISDQTFLKQLSNALKKLQLEDDFALQGFIQELEYERPLMSTLVLKSLDAAAKES
ncbi:hypothetical protein ACA910_003699 [Epithemia clementina (nom. ined.)]